MRINSIFESVSGEAGFFPQGTWCTFIRLQGCNLRCRWCDTVQSQDPEGGLQIDVSQIRPKTKHVLITGGEPLTQPMELHKLLNHLLPKHEVQIETNGSLAPIELPLSTEVGWVVDYKCPSSSVSTHMPTPGDFMRRWIKEKFIVKFVIDTSDPSDLAFACAVMKQILSNGYENKFIVSPLNAIGMSIPSLVYNIRDVDESLIANIIFSVQLHKLLHLA